MKKLLLTLSLGLTFLFAAACAPNATQLKELVEKNPDILFNAIEKNPEKFLDTVNKAARIARQQKEEKMMEDANKAREEEFTNPKKPIEDDGRCEQGS